MVYDGKCHSNPPCVDHFPMEKKVDFPMETGPGCFEEWIYAAPLEELSAQWWNDDEEFEGPDCDSTLV